MGSFYLIVLFFVLFVRILIIVVLYIGIIFISIKNYLVFKVFSFESGFIRVGKLQKSFSIHFFIMMLIFVVFDLEVILLLGLIVCDVGVLWSFFFLFIFICGGYVIEWFFGKLVWVIFEYFYLFCFNIFFFFWVNIIFCGLWINIFFFFRLKFFEFSRKFL